MLKLCDFGLSRRASGLPGAQPCTPDVQSLWCAGADPSTTRPRPVHDPCLRASSGTARPRCCWASGGTARRWTCGRSAASSPSGCSEARQLALGRGGAREGRTRAGTAGGGGGLGGREHPLRLERLRPGLCSGEPLFQGTSEAEQVNVIFKATPLPPPPASGQRQRAGSPLDHTPALGFAGGRHAFGAVVANLPLAARRLLQPAPDRRRAGAEAWTGRRGYPPASALARSPPLSQSGEAPCPATHAHPATHVAHHSSTAHPRAAPHAVKRH